MSLPDIRIAIVDALADAGLANAVATHSGRMTASDLKRLVIKGRSMVKVGLLGIASVDEKPTADDFTLQWAAYVLTLDAAGMDRDTAAMIVASAIARLIPGNLWGREDLDDPDKIRADNLYSGTVESRGVALWAVTWRQVWTPVEDISSSLDDFLRCHVEYDINQDGDSDITDVNVSDDIELPQ